jgi:hypothetical protein
MPNSIFQLANYERLIDWEKEPCEDANDAREFARKIADALKREGWDGGSGSYLAVIDELGEELFCESLIAEVPRG